jgi:hypothetical protein
MFKNDKNKLKQAQEKMKISSISSGCKVLVWKPYARKGKSKHSKPHGTS